jgi:two-component system chemotaxis sensor kinase CheA
MGEMDDIISEFLAESGEGLERLDRGLVALEQSPGDRALLADIFRCIHTIKGTSGFFGFGTLESVTHVGENLLSDLRDGTLALTPAITSGLLQLVDAVRSILSTVAATGSEGEQEFPELVALLTRLREGAPDPVPPPPSPSLPPRAGARRKRASRAVPAAAPVATPAGPGGPAETTLRVEVALLDKLMTLVGELVLARNQILQRTPASEDPAFAATTQRLNLITTELQEGVMKTRMQPISSVWSRLPRVVRDLALACGKQVRLEMDGVETELDKTIIEAIRDPLTHIVRNSVDHGIEPPAARVASGKPAEGRITLRAYHEGGQVYIEISDDGAGVDASRVRAKAVEKGILAADEAGSMDHRDLVQLVFAPGFSTAEAVSNLSGRGVGMDVVRTNIEKIGGIVDLQSRSGQGTTIKLKIPLTLAIVPALTVTVGGDHFAIPQVSLLELLRLDGAAGAIEMVQGVPVYRLRGRLLPLVSLAQTLGLPAGRGEESRGAGVVHVVVLQADGHTFGLVVDAIRDTQEIVVKPLGHLLQDISVFAGATIMGDGRVALILDIPGLAQRAGVVSGQRVQVDAEASPATPAGRKRAELLLFRAAGDRRMAMPLSRVARLEEFALSSVEQAGGHPVVQYRNGLLPLVTVGAAPPGAGAASNSRPLRVVVYAHEGQDVGLVVEDILDVVEETPAVHRRAGGGTVIGTAVIQDRVTELLDAGALIEESGVPLYSGREQHPAGAEA